MARAQGIVEAHAAAQRPAELRAAEIAAEVERQMLHDRPSKRKRVRLTVGASTYPAKLKCEACGAVMRDSEPNSGGGEYNHPRNGCRNEKWWFIDIPDARRPDRSIKVRGIVPVQPSRFTRAKRRAAKFASKYRPRRAADEAVALGGAVNPALRVGGRDGCCAQKVRGS